MLTEAENIKNNYALRWWTREETRWGVWEDAFVSQLSPDCERFLIYLKGIIADGYGRIGRVMGAYNDDKIYSVELVGAVCRTLLSFEE